MSEFFDESSFLKTESQIFWDSETLYIQHANLSSSIKERKDFLDTVESTKPIPVNLSIEIQKARTNKNLTRKQLANKINIKETELAKYETGKAIPDREVLRKLRRTLNCSKF